MQPESLSITPNSMRQRRAPFLAVTGFLVGIGVFLIIFGSLTFYINVRGLPIYFPCHYGNPPHFTDPSIIRVFLLGPGAMFYRYELTEFIQTDLFGGILIRPTQIVLLVLISGLPIALLGGILGFLYGKVGSFKALGQTFVFFIVIVLVLYGLTGIYSIIYMAYGCW